VPFTHIDVVEGNTDDFGDILNEILDSSEGVPGPVVGIDPVRPDPANADWIIACSFKPRELARGERRAAFDKLHQLDSREIHGYWEPFSDAGMASFREAEFQQKGPLDTFEVITFTTMLNQCAPWEIEPKRALARQFLAPNGVIIYQDRIMPDQADPSKLTFLENFNGYNYRTLVEFANDPNHVLYDVMEWETGRCQTMRPGPALDQLLAGDLT
jgi:hypothetical protein